jgi:hypothetical protein
MAKKPNPYKPTDVLYFQKPGEKELCRIERYTDGSVMVTGVGKKPNVYESADNALEKAVKAVEKRGLVRIPDPYAK